VGSDNAIVERCPARFRVVRDEYLEACRRRGNAEASVVTKQRTADHPRLLDGRSAGKPRQTRPRIWPGFWARRQRRGYAPNDRVARSALADFLRYLHEGGQIQEDCGRLPPHAIPTRPVARTVEAEEVRLVLGQIDRQYRGSANATTRLVLLTARLG